MIPLRAAAIEAGLRAVAWPPITPAGLAAIEEHIGEGRIESLITVVREGVLPSVAEWVAASEERREQEWAEAARGLLAAFDAGLFVRNTAFDDDSAWASKYVGPLHAMAKLHALTAEAAARPEGAARALLEPRA